MTARCCTGCVSRVEVDATIVADGVRVLERQVVLISTHARSRRSPGRESIA
jgi:hypothetical protein